VPEAVKQAGLARFHVGIREDGDRHELVIVTFWSNAEAVREAFGAHVEEASHGEVSRFAELRPPAQYEIDESVLRPSPDDPVVLRLQSDASPCLAPTGRCTSCCASACRSSVTR
jgi:hypothetical protein